MKFDKRLLQPRFAASIIVFIVLSGLVTSAKTVRPTSTTTPPPNENVVNLADFNPAGDGVGDDGPALQKALDALAENGGGTLFIPAGRYLIATPVTKDFSALPGAKVTIQGVPSNTMPAPPDADAPELTAGLDLTSEIIPAVTDQENALSLANLHQLTVEHIAFTGRETTYTDAFVTLYLSDIDQATIRHCEFYGISTFGGKPGFGGGNVVRALRSDMSIEATVFLGCTANSGAYAPVVENIEWRKFSISNSIFTDYGQRSFYGKMGLGAPLSWINVANAAATTPESPRREVVIRDIFLDEGGWVGITALPHRWDPASAAIDLIYISGLKMNVSNFGTAGHLFYDARNLLIENSHYGWSHNTIAAVDVNRFEHAILDQLTCVDDANRIRADAGTQRLTVINSNFEGIDSEAQTTRVIETSPENDPVQYVRGQFVSALGRPPDPAAHFYWSEMLLECENDNECVNKQRAALDEYLKDDPQTDFAIAGNVVDENGHPLSGATITLTGSQSSSATTDAHGNFRFSGLPTSGSYMVAAGMQHYSFTSGVQTVVHPADDVTMVFRGTLNRHSIAGQITKADGSGISGVTLQLLEAPAITVTTDADGFYSFPQLAAGEDYTVVPSANGFVFDPVNTSFDDLGADQAANFGGKLKPELIVIESSDRAIALDSVSFVPPPFSLFNSLGFSNDGMMRVMLFVKNLEPNTSQVSVTAEEDNGKTYALDIEYTGEIPGQSWLTQLNIKLSPTLLSGKCVQLRVSAAGVSSNNGRLCFAN